VHPGVGSKQSNQAGHVAAPDRGKEPGRQLVALAGGDVEPRPLGLDVLAGPARQLAAGTRAPADDAGCLVVAVAEDVVQQEHRPLQRRQPLEQQQERHRQRVGLLGVRSGIGVWLAELEPVCQQRLRQPVADVGLATRPGGAELIDRQSRDHRGQVSLGRIGLALARYRPVVAQERLLHDVLGLRHAAEHPIGDREQQRPEALVDGSGAVTRVSRHLVSCPAGSLRPSRVHPARL